MNIMVFDVPAETGGALSILSDFYKEVSNNNDKSITWIFVLSTPTLEETDNIKVLRFPWIKKSWAHRYIFDQFVAPQLVKQYRADKIVSLQNITIPLTRVSQTLYVHQPLPFIDYKFSFKENKLLWIYQNIIGRKIFSSIRKAKNVIVQTEWMKRACVDKAKVLENKVEVIPPAINIEINKFFYPTCKSFSTFFYPASGIQYKNHQVIVDACRELKSIGVAHQIVFTLAGNENDYVEKLYKQVEEDMLPIRFEGRKTREEVFEFYSKAILLFPSKVETYGLPMLEASLHRGIIIASNLPFSHEILDGYENAYFFDPNDTYELVVLMKRLILDKPYKHPSTEEVPQGRSSRNSLINRVSRDKYYSRREMMIYE